MTSIEEFVHALTLFIGITPPKPGQERKVGIAILITLFATAAGTVALVLFMARLMLR